MSDDTSFLLRRYQEQGVEFLLSGASRLLADEMGLGKTVQVAVALDRLRRSGAMKRTLIVCPSSLVTNWQRELARFGPSCASRTTFSLTSDDRSWLYRLPVPLTITSYESLRTDFLPVPPAAAFDVVVFDEAQRMKNRESTTALAGRLVKAHRRWLLSATPLENGVGDLGSMAEIMRLLAPSDGGDDPRAVTEALQGNFLRRRKADVLPELPPIIRQDIPLRLAGQQLFEYEALLRDQDWNGSIADLLALITRLKLACNSASDGSSVKLDALQVLLEGAEGSPVRMIVISQYTSTLRWLQQILPWRTLLFSGDVPTAERDQVLSDFQTANEPTLLMLSLKAGGVGLNIPESTHVVLFDRWWTPAAEAQAIARADRFGRKEPLLVYAFHVEDSVEERIVDISARKASLFEHLVEGSLTDGAEAHGWSRQDLLKVLDRA